jgi:predicted negative regulator of RcsB-dependent stress response
MGRQTIIMPTVPPPSRDATLDASIFWLRYKTELIAGLIIVLIVTAGFAGYRFYNDHRNSAASELLAGAKTIPDYQQLIDRYPGTSASASAYLLLAETQRNKKNFKEANATLQTFIDKFPQHELAGTARMAMAANFESMGKPDDALSTLQRLVANYPKSFNAPLALISQVHLLKAKGQIEEARRVCESCLTQYRDSPLAGEASRQLRQLRGGGAPKISPLPSNMPAAIPKVSAAPSPAPPSNPAPVKKPQ